MITLIVGSKGVGKTKQMVELINESVKTSPGNVVCIEKGMQLTYDLDHKCRLIDLDEYKIEDCDALYGFVAGILAGNYDIVEVYIDGVLKVIDFNLDQLAALLEKLDALSGSNCKFIITVSQDPANLPEGVKKYM